MGAIKLVDRLPPVPLPEKEDKDLLDIEEEGIPLPPTPRYYPGQILHTMPNQHQFHRKPGPRPTDFMTGRAQRSMSIRHKAFSHFKPSPHHKTNPVGPTVSSSSLGTLNTDLTEGSEATFRGDDIGLSPQVGLQDIIYRMRHEDQARAIYFLQQIGPTSRDSNQYLDRSAHVGDHSQSDQPTLLHPPGRQLYAPPR